MACLQSCCGFCTLSSGTVISAIFILVANVVEIALAGAFMATDDCGPIGVITIGICILCIFSSMLVMTADDIEERSKFLPFIFVVPCSILWFFVDILVHLERYARIVDLNVIFILGLLEMSFEMYAVVCVYSYYQDCASRSKFASNVSYITTSPTGGGCQVVFQNEVPVQEPRVIGNTEVKHMQMNCIPRSNIIGGPITETHIKSSQRSTSEPPPRPPLPKKLHVHWLMDNPNNPEVFDQDLIARQRELYERLHYATVPRISLAFSDSSEDNPIAPPRQKRSETSSLASYTK